MIDISLNKITKSYGFGNVLDNISFDISTGERVALIGPNGSGKSTVLKIIMGVESTSSGKFSLRKNITIGYLNQVTNEEKESIIVKDLLYRSVKDITAIEEQLRVYENNMLILKDEELDKIILKYTNLQEKFMSMGGYEICEKIGKIVNGFKIGHLLEADYNNLSGGEKRIVSFAALMIKNPDILLLDEPTNHLDIDTLEWLEKYLNKYKGTVLMVSHDRYFLNKVVNKIILLEDGTIDIYFGNYSYYLEENERREMLEFKNYNNQQKQINAMKESIKRLREFGNLGENEKFFKRANAMEKRLEKIEKLNKPKAKTNIPLAFNLNNRSGNEVLVIKKLDFYYGDRRIFNHVNMSIRYGEHVCLMGKNGSGKSTLIKEILHQNEFIKVGNSVKIGYISQEIRFDSNISVYDTARKYFNGEESHLRSALFKFMFIGDVIYKLVDNLSGGEKVRLKLFCLMQEQVNFLILDEPTNHIDIRTREILEDTLSEYQGTILFVSHDRYFINKVATKIFNIEDMRLIEYLGNYDDYVSNKN